MAEKKQITAISVVTDSETSYDNIGDIDGDYMDEEWLKKHIESHGCEQLLETIARMTYQVIKVRNEINKSKQDAETTSSTKTQTNNG